MEIAQRIEALRALPPERLLQGANSWLPTATAIVLVPVIAWYGAGLIWALLPGQPSYDWTRKAPATAMPVAAPRQTAAVDFGAIAAAHLFGEADAEPPPQTAVTAPDTRLNLKLRGTIAADDETIAHAIIVDGNSKANVYFIEDAIPGGASLHEVYPDRVILKRGGAFETLRLPKESQGAARQTTAPFPGPPASTMGASARSPASNSSLAAFTEIIRPQPFMPNGQLKGYRVYPGRDRRAFAALGLRPGDLVTDINGQSLNDIQSGMDAFRALGDVSQVTVTIERNGSPMVMTLDTNQFSNASGARR